MAQKNRSLLAVLLWAIMPLACASRRAATPETALQKRITQLEMDNRGLIDELNDCRKKLAPEPTAEKGKVCYPPNWQGIVTGISLDRDVVAMHGPGLFSEDLGHGGGRYYTDPQGLVTAIVSIGVDNVIESVVVLAGFQPPETQQSDSWPAMISKHIELAQGRVWLDLRFGDDIATVQTRLGLPAKQDMTAEGTGFLSYDAADAWGECFADADVGLEFRDGGLFRIELDNGE